MSAGNKMDGKMSGKVIEADRDKTVTEPNMDRSDISLPQRPSQSLLTTKRPAVFLTIPQRILCTSRFKDNFEMRSAVRVWLVMHTKHSPSGVKLKTVICAKAFHLCLSFSSSSLLSVYPTLELTLVRCSLRPCTHAVIHSDAQTERL